jgi:RHS repeat-associated protein
MISETPGIDSCFLQPDPKFYGQQGLWQGYSLFGNRFLFTGREWLSDVKVYDFRNRMYQPELGRFLQPDPKEFAAGDYNLYRYCHNDPVNKSDPTGLETLTRPEIDEQVGNRIVELSQSLGHEIAEAYREQGPIMFFVNAGMMLSRGPKVEGIRLPGFRPPLGTRVRPEGLPTNWRIRTHGRRRRNSLLQSPEAERKCSSYAWNS